MSVEVSIALYRLLTLLNNRLYELPKKSDEKVLTGNRVRWAQTAQSKLSQTKGAYHLPAENQVYF